MEPKLDDYSALNWSEPDVRIANRGWLLVVFCIIQKESGSMQLDTTVLTIHEQHECYMSTWLTKKEDREKVIGRPV